MTESDQKPPYPSSPAQIEIEAASAFDPATAGTALAIGADCLERLAESFESSARRWQLVVFPAMFAFIILAVYGFYLIYSLTTDVTFLANSVDRNLTFISAQMEQMSTDLDHVSADLRSVAVNMDGMSRNIEAISTNVATLEPILVNMSSMTDSMRTMTVNTNRMSGDMTHLNRSIGRPMSFMNDFLPW